MFKEWLNKEIPVNIIHDDKPINKLKDEEKKEKKRSPFLPWSKGKDFAFVKIKI